MNLNLSGPGPGPGGPRPMQFGPGGMPPRGMMPQHHSGLMRSPFPGEHMRPPHMGHPRGPPPDRMRTMPPDMYNYRQQMPPGAQEEEGGRPPYMGGGERHQGPPGHHFMGDGRIPLDHQGRPMMRGPPHMDMEGRNVPGPPSGRQLPPGYVLDARGMPMPMDHRRPPTNMEERMRSPGDSPIRPDMRDPDHRIGDMREGLFERNFFV